MLLLLPESGSSQQPSDAFDSGHNTDTAASAFDDDDDEDSFSLDQTLCAPSGQASPLPALGLVPGLEAGQAKSSLKTALDQETGREADPGSPAPSTELGTGVDGDLDEDCETRHAYEDDADATESAVHESAVHDADMTPKAIETAVRVAKPLALHPPTEVVLELLTDKADEPHVAFATTTEGGLDVDDGFDLVDLPFDRAVIKVWGALGGLGVASLMHDAAAAAGGARRRRPYHLERFHTVPT